MQKASDLLPELRALQRHKIGPAVSVTVEKIADGAAAIRDMQRGDEDISYCHAVLAQVSLPRRPIAGRVFERRSGSVSLRVKAGELWQPHTETWEEQPVPWGPVPRYVLAWLNTFAIRNKTREIPLGDSARQFMEEIGYKNISGGRKGSYTSLKTQARALAACSMQLGHPGGTFDGKPVSNSQMWMSEDVRQRALWPASMVLTHDYYESLQERAVPLNNTALLAMRQSALALDIYAWLAHRLYRVNERSGTFVSWASLKEQFGDEYPDDNDGRANFKKEFLRTLQTVKLLYPAARVDQCFQAKKSRPLSCGLTLLQSPPPIAKAGR